jgi:hypothetical protein
MSNFKTVAYLMPGHELYKIFPDGVVPVVSVFPLYSTLKPDPFLVVNGRLLADWQVYQLVEHFLHRFPNLFCNQKDAEAFVIEGFPLPFSHFDGGGTEDLNAMLAALEVILGEAEESGSLGDDGELDR